MCIRASRNYLLERLDKGKEIDWYSIFAEDVFRFTEEGRYLDLSDLKGVENLSEDEMCIRDRTPQNLDN